MQPPISHGYQDLDGRLLDPNLLSLYRACTNIYAWWSIGGSYLIGNSLYDSKHYTRRQQRAFSLILAGDFNRHYPAWGNNHTQPRLVEDASDLDQFHLWLWPLELPPSGNRDLLVVKLPREKLHDRPDSNKHTGPTHQTPSLPRQLWLGPLRHLFGMVPLSTTQRNH